MNTPRRMFFSVESREDIGEVIFFLQSILYEEGEHEIDCVIEITEKPKEVACAVARKSA